MKNQFSLLLVLVLALLMAGCGSVAGVGSNEPLSTPTPTASLVFATPTVDIDHARQTCESGGELSYEEVIALKPEFATDMNFGSYLEKCKLKETIGWIAGWFPSTDREYKIIPNKNRVGVYVYNPFSGSSKEFVGYAEISLVYVTDEELAQLKYGQRIKFTGDLLLVDRTVSIENPKYSILEDEPRVPPPTADELEDLEIRLDRTMCLGWCPDYALTITSDGKVTFEGRTYTKVKGIATSTVDKAKLEELAMEIKKTDFFSLLDKYYPVDMIVTDNPTYTLSVQMGGNRKTVENYASGPRRLYLLQDRIDQIVNSDQWIKCDPGPCP